MLYLSGFARFQVHIVRLTGSNPVSRTPFFGLVASPFDRARSPSRLPVDFAAIVRGRLTAENFRQDEADSDGCQNRGGGTFPNIGGASGLEIFEPFRPLGPDGLDARFRRLLEMLHRFQRLALSRLQVTNRFGQFGKD